MCVDKKDTVRVSAYANTTAGGDEVALLQAGETGAMIFLSVDKRDTIDLAVNANYERAPTGNAFLGTAYDALFISFDAAYGSGVEHGVSSSSSVFDEALNGIDMSGKGNSSTAPRAFVNYIFFDQEMNYVRAGFLQITTAAQGIGVHETISLNDIIADRKGYILAYLSNENAEEVAIHWDDFTVYQGKTNVVFASSYYPGGFTFNEHQRTASVKNKWKFQSKEWLPELRVYDFGPRGWDPLTWRTNARDILANKFPDQSSYSLFRNNPILFIDPDGRWPYTFHIRSFVTNSSFAGGFKGRGSGFSTDVGALSKIHQYVTYETNGGYIADQGFKSTMSAWYPGVAGAFSIPFRFPLNLAIGKVNPSGSAIANGNGFSGLMRAGNAVTEKWLWGGMGAIQPEIDIRYSVQLNESDDGLLSLSLQAEGDGFPDAEAFVIDKKGNQIFVGGYSKNSYGSPFWSLGGEGDTQMMNSNFQIMTNGKGIFTGVKYDGQEYSIEEWNGASDGSMTLEEFKEDYGDLYNMMFNNR